MRLLVVGGGGMIPGYTESLAEQLGIVKERVAIRGQEVMQSIHFEMNNPRKDALMVTPTGICLSYYLQSNNFIFVEFNGVRIKLYDNGKLTVADAAMQSNLSNDALFPRRGTPLTFTVNGKSRMARGVQGEAAVIKVNGEPASINTQIHSGDSVEVIPSTAGAEAVVELGNLPEFSERLHVYVNGSKIDLPKTASVNGKLENEFYHVQEGDNIQVQNYYTVREIAEFMDVPLGGPILVNDTPAQPETKVYENFTLSWDVNAAVMEQLEREAEEARKAAEAKEAEEAKVRAEEEARLAAELKAKEEAKAAEEARIRAEVEARVKLEVEARMKAEAEMRAKIEAEAKADAEAKAAAQLKASEDAAKEEAARLIREKEEARAKMLAEREAAEASVVDGTAADTVSIQETAEAVTTMDDAASGSATNETGEPEAVESPEAPKVPVDVTVIANGRPVVMTGKSSYVYVDIFSFIQFDLSRPNGRAIVTNLNGRAAEYMEPLKNGDVIEIYWKENKR